MGASSSHPAEDSVLPPVRAFHVLRVTPGSPASQTDIEPFFDFVVSVEQGLLGDGLKGIDVHHLERIVENHESKPLHLIVWSSKAESYREVVIVPSRLWSIPTALSPHSSHSRLPSASHSSHSRTTSFDDGPPNTRKPSLLGLSMRVCEPAIALDNVWHILDVLEGSPAESAGLVPFGDWIIGWSGGVLREENDFLDVVEAHVDKPLRVYVYSYDFDTLREVVLVPNRMWGGEGLLGCGVGFGLLHRIPKLRKAAFAPEQDVFAQLNGFDRSGHGQTTLDSMQEQELFVPADDIFYDDEETRESERDRHPDAQAPGESLLPSRRLIATNPFLPEEDSDILPRAQNEVVLSTDGAATEHTRSRSPSPASTPTPTSFHGSELASEPSLGQINPVPQPRSPNLPTPINSFRQLSAGGAWGGAANRFSAAPARRATPTQFNPNGRHQPVEDGSDSDDGKDGSRGFRRSPSGSMTSVDD